MMWVAYTHLRCEERERRKNRGIIKDRMLEAKLFLTAVDFSMATSRTHAFVFFLPDNFINFYPKKGGSWDE